MQNMLLVALCVGVALAIFPSPAWHKTSSSLSMPGYSGASNFTQHYGLIPVNQQYGVNYFYWLCESQGNPRTDPLVLWLTGGPGCSSELALFFENGPWTVQKKFLRPPELVDNAFSWNKIANVLWVDQPGGTGFSTVQNSLGYAANEQTVGQDMVNFLQAFFQKYPQYKGLPFYITGESYGGHYVPVVAKAVVDSNAQNPPYTIPLKAMAIGNGLIDPLYTTQSYPAYAYGMGVIDYNCMQAANALFPQCQQDIESGDYQSAFNDCNNVFGQVLQCAPGINYYDVRKQCNPAPLCYDMTPIADYLNQRSVRDKLGVGDTPWQACSQTVYQYLESDFERSYRRYLPYVMARGVRTTIYEGVEDLICNFYGQSAALESMSWSYQSQFNSAPNKTWSAAGQRAGTYRHYNNLTYVTVDAAGHMVPHDQPAAALELLRRFLGNLYL